LSKSNTDRAAAVNIIRHAILTGVKYYNKKFASQYGELVLACDGRSYWRKDVFPYYKAGRKAVRDKSELDWKLIFDTISEIRDDIAEHFPYRVIHNDRAEADDIVATLCKWTQTNGYIDHGMFEQKQKVLIVSSDGDFKQLHKYDNVEQYSPIQKKFVKCDDPVRYLAEHIAKAGDDGIPNVLSADDVFVTPTARQSKMTAAKLARFVELGRDAWENDQQRRNWDRNNQLINFDAIPQEISQQIIDRYVNSKPKGDKMSIYNYLIKHQCRLLLDEIEQF
jgi:hypothetical protein